MVLAVLVAALPGRARAQAYGQGWVVGARTNLVSASRYETTDTGTFTSRQYQNADVGFDGVWASVGGVCLKQLWLNSRVGYHWSQSQTYASNRRSESERHAFEAVGNIGILLLPGRRVRPYLGALAGVEVTQFDGLTTRERKLGGTAGMHVFVSPAWSIELGFDIGQVRYAHRIHRGVEFTGSSPARLAGWWTSLQVGVAFWPGGR